MCQYTVYTKNAPCGAFLVLIKPSIIYFFPIQENFLAALFLNIHTPNETIASKISAGKKKLSTHGLLVNPVEMVVTPNTPDLLTVTEAVATAGL